MLCFYIPSKKQKTPYVKWSFERDFVWHIPIDRNNVAPALVLEKCTARKSIVVSTFGRRNHCRFDIYTHSHKSDIVYRKRSVFSPSLDQARAAETATARNDIYVYIEKFTPTTNSNKNGNNKLF